MKLNVISFAIASCIFCGIALFTLTWWFIARGIAGEGTIFGQIYPFYSATPLGSVAGLVFGGMDGFFSGLIFAWLYNMLASKSNTRK